MFDEGNSSGTGVTSIWDLIVLMIFARMFGFGMNGMGGNEGAAVTAATVESIARNVQDTQNTQNSIAAVMSKLQECCCNNLLGQKDIELNMERINNQTQAGFASVITNQNSLATAAEIRELTQKLNAAENALNNCNQSAVLTNAINNAVNPIAQTLAAVVAQLNCGVKSIPYTQSVPLAYAPAPNPFGQCGPNPFAPYPMAG